MEKYYCKLHSFLDGDENCPDCKSGRVELPVKPEIAEVFKMIDKLEKDVTVNIAPLTTIGKSLVEGYTKALQHLRNEIRKQFSV